MRFSKLPLAMVTAAGMFLGSPAFGYDEPAREGLIRISDAKPVSQPTPDPVSSNGSVASSGVVAECSAECEDDGDGLHCHCPKYHWPDYGYARIQKNPIHRMPVQYYRYWPARWYGEPGSGIAPHALRFPVIYTPTDTTQLGVYYQQVPQWLPNPAMLPPAPWPTQWHRRECAYYGSGYDRGYAMQGPVSESSGPTPVENLQKAAEPAPPPPPQEVPPAPEKSAMNRGIQQSEF